MDSEHNLNALSGQIAELDEQSACLFASDAARGAMKAFLNQKK